MLFVILSSLDLLFTCSLLTLGGKEMEFNPLASWLYARGGIPWLCAFKIVMVLGLIEIFNYVDARKPRYGRFIYNFACIMTGIAVIMGIIAHAYIRRI